MNPVATAYLSAAARSVTKYLDQIERTLARVSDDDVWARPNEASNSLGNLLMHLSGSHRFWICSVVGGQASHRKRQEEFDARDGATKDELIANLRETVADANAVLAGLSGDELLEKREAFGKPTTVLDAIHHTTVHFTLHAGQVFQLVKVRKGIDIGLPM